MKNCQPANAERPTVARISSVQFHPGAQIVMVAGLDNAVSLFQVCVLIYLCISNALFLFKNQTFATPNAKILEKKYSWLKCHSPKHSWVSTEVTEFICLEVQNRTSSQHTALASCSKVCCHYCQSQRLTPCLFTVLVAHHPLPTHIFIECTCMTSVYKEP